MKHPTTRELFDYWNQRRGLRAAPERGDIDPGQIRSLLADTFVLSFDVAAGHPFRIAGTRLCALFGRELKDRPFISLWDDGPRMRDLLDDAAHEAIGMVGGAHAIVDGVRLDLELLALPLSQGGRMPARFIGALAALSPPVWAFAQPVPALALDVHRYLSRRLEQPAHPFVSGAQAMRRREGLVVIEGGRF
jgi:hypothetical protein